MKLFREKPKLSINPNEGGVYSEKKSYITPDRAKKYTVNYLEIIVKNSGGMAKGCRAELKVINSSFNSIKPTENPKFLEWYISSNHSLQKDIARNREEYVYVVFSDSRLKDLPNKDIYAFTYTYDLLEPIIQKPRGEYGFGLGDFEIEIIVTSDNDAIVKSKFFLHVDKDFRKLNMKKISKKTKSRWYGRA